MNNSISIEITVEEITNLLKKALYSSQHKDILTKVIMGNLEITNVGLSQLFKALQGIDNEIKWKVGMNILLKENMLYSSSIDKVKMIEKGMIHQGWVKAHIIKVDIYNSYPLTVKYDMINKDNEIQSNTQTVSLDYVTNDDELIEFLPINDILPF
jgi:hypothetical protein